MENNIKIYCDVMMMFFESEKGFVKDGILDHGW
jgi:hypothetical protein